MIIINLIRSFDLDKEKNIKESISIKNEENELKYKSQMLKINIDNDSKLLGIIIILITTLIIIINYS